MINVKKLKAIEVPWHIYYHELLYKFKKKSLSCKNLMVNVAYTKEWYPIIKDSFKLGIDIEIPSWNFFVSGLIDCNLASVIGDRINMTVTGSLTIDNIGVLYGAIGSSVVCRNLYVYDCYSLFNKETDVDVINGDKCVVSVSNKVYYPYHLKKDINKNINFVYGQPKNYYDAFVENEVVELDEHITYLLIQQPNSREILSDISRFVKKNN